MSWSSSNESYEFIGYDEYNEPMAWGLGPNPTPPPSPPYPYAYQVNPSPPYPYAYAYPVNPITDWVPAGLWTPWTPYNTPVPNSYLAYAIPYENPHPWEWTPWTPYFVEPYPWINYGIDPAGMFTPPPSPVYVPAGSILTPPMLLVPSVPMPMRQRWYSHRRPRQNLALRRNARPRQPLALRGNQEHRHELTIWDQIQGSFEEMQSSSRDRPAAEELASEVEEQPDNDEHMDGADEMRAYELNEVGVEEVQNALERDEVEEMYIAYGGDEMEDLSNTLAGDNAEEILDALVAHEKEDPTNALDGNEEEDPTNALDGNVEENHTAESSFEVVEPIGQEAENNDHSDENPLLLHMKECGVLSCKDRGKPHMHTPNGNWIF